MTSRTILILPSGDAGIATPRAWARLRRPVTANSRPMMTATIHAGARSICTSEMNAAVISSLSASGSMHLAERGDLLAAAREVAVEPVGERRDAEDRRADELLAARRGSAAPRTSSAARPRAAARGRCASSVSAFGRFIDVARF